MSEDLEGQVWAGLDQAHVLSEVEIRAVVTRKDGTREDLGTVSHWKNPLREALRKLFDRKEQD